LVEEEVLRGQVTDALRDAVFEVATAASDHLLAARSLAVAAAVPPAARRALLPAVRRPFPATLSVYSRWLKVGLVDGWGGAGAGQVTCTDYLRRLEAVNFDVLHPTLQQRSWRLPFALAQAVLAGAYWRALYTMNTHKRSATRSVGGYQRLGAAAIVAAHLDAVVAVVAGLVHGPIVLHGCPSA
jgi:hypothetical protein